MFKNWSVALAVLCLLLFAGAAYSQESKPVVPPQPDRLIYGPSDLVLLKTYTRETYEKEFGVQAPPFDTSRRPKYWFDSTVDLTDPEALVAYKIVSMDKGGNPVIRTMAMTAQEAATVNMAGRPKYPEYNVLPTKATQKGVDGSDIGTINPDMLALKSQAVEMSNALGCPGEVEEQSLTFFPYFYPKDEPRRVYAVCGTFNVGAMLRMQNQAGVGAPGKWKQDGDGHIWVPDPPAPDGANNPRPFAPIPVRDLLPNETLKTTPFGVQVVRTDKQADEDKKAGKFTPEDRELLQRIYELLKGRG